MKIFYIYLVSVSLLAFVLTLYDKCAARKGAWRVSEKALMCVAAFGGAVSMYLTMLFIRHKTKHVIFMAGLPLIFVLQLMFAAFVLHGIGRL